MLNALEIEAEHIDTLARMTPTQFVAMSREILANQIRVQALSRGIPATRLDTLQTVFQAEEMARASGAQPKADFFVPLSNELPTDNAIVPDARA